MARHELNWPIAALHETLALAWPDAVAEVVAEIDSTNSELMRRAKAGRVTPTLLVAESQTAGRGRLGRRWETPVAGAALTFSLGLPLAPQDWSGLSLAVGVATAGSLHADVRLKWPNDLWWHERKLTGILIETTALPAGRKGRYAVIGIGLNVMQPPAGDYRTAPAWMTEWQPDATPPAALQRILSPLTGAILQFERSGFASFRAAFEARDVFAGRAVRLSDGTEGVACGVALDGALRVRTVGGEVREIRSSEVSVRPAVHAAGAAD